jgi:recombination protein RecR
MEYPSRTIEAAVEAFAKLPSIGRKSALRLVLHLLKAQPEDAHRLAQAIVALKEDTRRCEVCHNIAEERLCGVCLNTRRNPNLICVVEDIRDLLAIERTGHYTGTYHVLEGLISPLDGIGPGQLNVESLLRRLAAAPASEVILALNARMEGETTAFYLARKIGAELPQIKISSLARGVSVGGELEYADELTLSRSLLHRVPYASFQNPNNGMG